MTSKEFETWLIERLSEVHEQDPDGDMVTYPLSYSDAGMLNVKHGVVVRMQDEDLNVHEFRVSIHEAR